VDDVAEDPTSELVESPAGRVMILPAQGPALATADEMVDLIGDAMFGGVAWMVLPQERLGDDFFWLRTGIAGEVAQKFVNYRVGLVVLGDITRFTEASPSLRDFVRETNAGRQLWFVRDRAELDARLGRSQPPR
jgi:hypothetical protein